MDILATDSATVHVFERKTDIYWKSTLAYALGLVFYTLFKIVMEQAKPDAIVNDPIVVLLAIFVVLSGIVYLVQAILRRQIIIDSSGVKIVNRIRTLALDASDITKVSFMRTRASQKGSYRVIILRLRSRRRGIRIRPALYTREQTMLRLLNSMRRHLVEVSAAEETGTKTA